MTKTVDTNGLNRKRRIPKGVRDTYWTKKHNMCETPLYYVWQAIKQRCYNKNNPKYKIYGDKGICMCEEWKNDFVAFMDWALENGYNVNLTIDRIDSNGNYCPENCRWATYEQQGNNTCRNVFIEFNGKKMTISQWAHCLGIEVGTLNSRLRKGWSIEKALTTPVNLFYRRNYKND